MPSACMLAAAVGLLSMAALLPRAAAVQGSGEGRFVGTPQLFDNGDTEEAITDLLGERLQEIFYDSVDVSSFPLAAATVFFVPQAYGGIDCAEVLGVPSNIISMQSWLEEAVEAADDGNVKQVYTLTSTCYCTTTADPENPGKMLQTFAVEAIVLNMLQTSLLRTRFVDYLQAKHNKGDNLIMVGRDAAVDSVDRDGSMRSNDGGGSGGDGGRHARARRGVHDQLHGHADRRLGLLTGQGLRDRTSRTKRQTTTGMMIEVRVTVTLYRNLYVCVYMYTYFYI